MDILILGGIMKAIIVILISLFTSHHAHAYTTYDLQCWDKKESFTVNIDAERNSLQFKKTNKLRFNVDKYIFPAYVSENYVLVDAKVTTYQNYFDGYVRFYLGKGLKKIKDGEVYKIAMDADDGDGYGFDKRTFSCRVKHRRGVATTPDAQLEFWDDCYESVMAISKGVANTYKSSSLGIPARILNISPNSIDEMREYSLDLEADGCIDAYRIILHNDSAYKCMLEKVQLVQSCG